MSNKPIGQEILAMPAKKFGATPRSAGYDSAGNMISLDLSALALSQLTSQIGHMTNLRMLDLQGN
jgi:hypothetical protein